MAEFVRIAIDVPASWNSHEFPCENLIARNRTAALAAAGVITLDKQAEALGLSRSTAWHLLNGKHKGSGISATVINRMLAASRLPSAVRVTILEYIAEKVAGRYGDTKLRLSKFTARIPRTALDHSRAIGGTRRDRPALRFPNPKPAMPRNRSA